MSRSEVSVASAAWNSGVAVSRDALDLTNDHFLDVSGVVGEKLGIFIENSSTIPATLTLKAGDNFSNVSIGDKAITLPASGNLIVAVELARFKDSDEYILIDAASTGSATGYISAFELP